jgi:hypothetical protein
VGRLADGAHVVDPRQQAAEQGDLLVVELVRRAPAGAGPDGVVDALDLVECISVGEAQRCADGDLGLPKLGEEAVLVEDRLAAPAPGPVELHHDVPSPLEPQVVDPVLETGERRAVAGGIEAAGLHRREDAVGREVEEEIVVVRGGFGRQRLEDGVGLGAKGRRFPDERPRPPGPAPAALLRGGRFVSLIDYLRASFQ